MKKFVGVMVTLSLLVLAGTIGRAESVIPKELQKDFQLLSPAQQVEMIQRLEERFIRKDAVRLIQYEEKARKIIGQAVDIALGKNSQADPQQGIKIIIDSDLDGETKLEIIKLIQDVTNDSTDISLSRVENKLSDIDMKLSRIARALGSYEDIIFTSPNLQKNLDQEK